MNNHQHRRLGLIAVLLLAGLGNFAVAAQEPLGKQYETAQQHYDIDLATRTRDSLRAQETTQSLLYAKLCLLIAELHRINYEESTTSEGDERRELGARIDEAAEEGLSAVQVLNDSSEKYRVQGDLYGCMIRTKFQARKYRRKMEESIAQARAMDSKNPKALLSAAKPFLFGKDSEENLSVALELINQALELNPASEQAFLLRGLAHDKMGKPEQARLDWNQALKINSDSTLAKTALSKQD